MLDFPCGAFLGITVSDPGVIAALIALGTLILRAIGLVISGQQARQRDLFSKAYGAAMSWNEMLYRIRRRPNSAEAETDLIARFHHLQEQIDYYEGWAASEGAAIGRSYCQLVVEVKSATGRLIQQAWREPGRAPGVPAPEEEVHPDLHEVRLRFLTDVRAQLSLWLLPRVGVVYRNRKSKKNEAIC